MATHIRIKASQLGAIEELRGPRGLTGARGSGGFQGIPGPEGPEGPEGPKGEKGDQGPQGEQGQQGIDGSTSVDGKPGDMPRHKWEDTSLSFEVSPGVFSAPVDLKGDEGVAGTRGAQASTLSSRPEPIRFFKVVGFDFTVKKSWLTEGTNIFRVSDTSSPVLIRLPQGVGPRSLIYINDESGNAEANNITVQVG